MNKFFSNRYILLLLRLVLGFVFVYAGAEKIADPSQFAESISNYQLLNEFFITLTAVLLPWIELFTGIFLISGIAVKESSLIISIMLFVLIAAAVISIARGLDIDCGCFGDASVRLGMTKIIENLLLLSAGILLIIYGSDTFSLSGTE